MLRLAVHYGFVMGGDDRTSGKVVFWNNAVSSVLREDHPNSVRCGCTLSCPGHARTLCSLRHNLGNGATSMKQVPLILDLRSGNPVALLHREDHRMLECRALACHHMEDSYGPWSRLLPGLLTDRVPAHLWLRDVTGRDMDVWQYLGENPAQEQQFSRAMTCVDNLVRASCQSCIVVRCRMCRI